MSDIEMITDLKHTLAAWIDVAMTRQELIDQLKAEKRQLAHEVERLTASRYCTRCGGAFPGEHDCGRNK